MMTDLKYYIKYREEGVIPVGYIFQFWGQLDGFIECNGQQLNRTLFPELFSVIGYSYTKQDIPVMYEKTKWEKFLMKIGFNVRDKWYHISTPDFDPNYFNVPDLRGRQIKDFA